MTISDIINIVMMAVAIVAVCFNYTSFKETLIDHSKNRLLNAAADFLSELDTIKLNRMNNRYSSTQSQGENNFLLEGKTTGSITMLKLLLHYKENGENIIQHSQKMKQEVDTYEPERWKEYESMVEKFTKMILSVYE